MPAGRLLVDRKLWESCSANGINGVRQHYSWDSHSESLLESLKRILARMPEEHHLADIGAPPVGKRFTSLRRLVITDVDNTLVGDEAAMLELLGRIAERKEMVGWGVATGRNLQMTVEALADHDIPMPDVIICSVGTEIFYGAQMVADTGWQQHLAYQWKPNLIRQVLARLSFLELQEEETQRRFKISYYVDPIKDPDLLTHVHKALRDAKIRYQLVFSNGQFLDILPFRASKGKAIRYLSYKWELPLGQISWSAAIQATTRICCAATPAAWWLPITARSWKN